MATQYTTREDPGGRFVAAAQVKGRNVEVVTGWDINEDRWRYHVYVADKQTGNMEKIHIGHPVTGSMDAAIEEGFQVAAAAIA